MGTAKTVARTRAPARLRVSALRTHEEILKHDLTHDAVFRREWKRTLVARAVGMRVLSYRTGKDLTQDALARKLGMKQSAVARLEVGEHTPSFATLELLSRKLGLEFVIDIRPSGKASKFVRPGTKDESVEFEVPTGTKVLVATG
jgi:transcriptional regulator with XRE-family HTH domain